jgi:hypothetical protein
VRRTLVQGNPRPDRPRAREGSCSMSCLYALSSLRSVATVGDRSTCRFGGDGREAPRWRWPAWQQRGSSASHSACRCVRPSHKLGECMHARSGASRWAMSATFLPLAPRSLSALRTFAARYASCRSTSLLWR